MLTVYILQWWLEDEVVWVSCFKLGCGECRPRVVPFISYLCTHIYRASSRSPRLDLVTRLMGLRLRGPVNPSLSQQSKKYLKSS